ncbi:MAG: AI-2E family transporter [Deltaproteobacteria bacterium]
MEERFSGRHLWEIRPVRDLALIAAAVSLLFFLFGMRRVLMPAFAGLLFAYIVEPAVKSARDRWKIPRSVTVSILLAAGMATAILIGVWLLPLIVNQGYALLKTAPHYLNELLMRISARFGIAGEDMMTKFQPEPIFLLRFLGGVITAASETIFWFFLLPFFFFAFSWKFPAIVRRAEAMAPSRHREKVMAILKDIDSVCGNYFRGRLLIGVVSGFLMASGFFLTAVPYWFLLGMLGGLLGIVPYLSVLALIAALLFKYLAVGSTAGWQEVFLWPGLAFTIIHTLEEWVLIPLIQSYSVKLSPVTIIIALLIGGAAYGAGGLLFAIPIAGTIKVLITATGWPAMRRYFG